MWGFSWERKFRGNLPGNIISQRKFHWTVQIIQQQCQSFNVAKTHSKLQVQIIQRNTNHSAYYKAFNVSLIVYKSFNVVKIHSTSLLQIIQHCTNYWTYWKWWNNHAGFINIKVEWKTDIGDTIETFQNYQLYNSTS